MSPSQNDTKAKGHSTVCRNILSTILEKGTTKLIVRSLNMQQDNDLKYTQPKRHKSLSGAGSGSL